MRTVPTHHAIRALLHVLRHPPLGDGAPLGRRRHGQIEREHFGGTGRNPEARVREERTFRKDETGGGVERSCIRRLGRVERIDDRSFVGERHHGGVRPNRSRTGRAEVEVDLSRHLVPTEFRIGRPLPERLRAEPLRLLEADLDPVALHVDDLEILPQHQRDRFRAIGTRRMEDEDPVGGADPALLRIDGRIQFVAQDRGRRGVLRGDERRRWEGSIPVEREGEGLLSPAHAG